VGGARRAAEMEVLTFEQCGERFAYRSYFVDICSHVQTAPTLGFAISRISCHRFASTLIFRLGTLMARRKSTLRHCGDSSLDCQLHVTISVDLCEFMQILERVSIFGIRQNYALKYRVYERTRQKYFYSIE